MILYLQFLSKNFDMKDIDEASYVIDINIHRFLKAFWDVYHKTYMNKVLKRFQMKICSPSIVPIVKDDKFNLNQCPNNNFGREQMKKILYAYVGSLVCSQICKRPHIAFVVGILRIY